MTESGEEKVLAGFDLGGTKLRLVLATSDGRELARLREPVDLAGEEFGEYRDGLAYWQVSRQMIRLLHGGLRQAGVPAAHLGAIGIGSAGPIAAGSLKDPSNIKPERLPPRVKGPLYIPLVEPLEREFGVPVRLENDCLVGVLGEVYYGLGRDEPDKTKLFMVYVTLSTGFGGGVWDGGHLLRGKDGNAAEVGHFPVCASGSDRGLKSKVGLRCGCGNYGCAEAYCSGRGIAKNARLKLLNEDLRPPNDYGAQLWELAGHDLNKVTAPLVFEAAARGDRLAREVLEEAAWCGGLAFAAIANAYDPQVITVGGSLALAHPELLESIAVKMQEHLNVAPPQVRLTPLGERVVEYGALILAHEALQERTRSPNSGSSPRTGAEGTGRIPCQGAKMKFEGNLKSTESEKGRSRWRR